MTLTCDTGFRVKGDWLLICENGILNKGIQSKCARIDTGKTNKIHEKKEYFILTLHKILALNYADLSEGGATIAFKFV